MARRKTRSALHELAMERLEQLFAEGVSREELCERYGVGMSTVRSWVTELRKRGVAIGAPHKRGWSPEEDSILRAGAEAGLNVHQLADRLPGRSESAIYWRLSKLGISIARKRTLPQKAKRRPKRQPEPEQTPEPEPLRARIVRGWHMIIELDRRERAPAEATLERMAAYAERMRAGGRL